MLNRRPLSRLAVAIVALLFIGASLAACSSGNAKVAGGATTAPAGATAAGAPRMGGTLRQLVDSEFTTLDPVKALGVVAGSPGDALYGIFGALVLQEAPSGNIRFDMAQSLTTPDNGTTWLLKLRPNMMFTDGTPFDAAAVKFNWDRIKDPANGSPALLSMKQIQSYTAADPLTLQITLVAPDTQFPRLISGALTYIGSPTAIQKEGPGFASHPVGAGPFTLKEWVLNDHTPLVKNPAHWDAPRPYIDQLIIKGIIDEPGQRLNTFQTGGADIMVVRSDFRVANTAKSSGANVLALPQVVGSGLYMNEKAPGLNDKTVRQAFAMALDRQALAQTIYGENAPDGLFANSLPFYDPASNYPKHDLAKAQQLIDAYVAKTGTDIKLAYTVVANSPISLNFAQVVQAQLQQLKHVTITIQPLDVASITKESYAGQEQFGLLAVNGPWPDPSLYAQFDSKGNQNTIAYSSPTTDSAFAAAHGSQSTADQIAAYKRVAASMLDDMSFIATRHSVYALVSHPNVANVKAFSDGGLESDQVWLTR